MKSQLTQIKPQHVPARQFKAYVCTGQAGGMSVQSVVADKGFDLQTEEIRQTSA